MTAYGSVIGGLTAFAIGFGAPAALANTPFEGRWSVQIIAESEKCQLAHAIPISVENGDIRYNGSFNAIADGSVTRDGAVTVEFSRGADVVRAHGSLRGERGTGAWSTPTQECQGTWMARRS